MVILLVTWNGITITSGNFESGGPDLGSLVILRVPVPTWEASGITINSDTSGRLGRDNRKIAILLVAWSGITANYDTSADLDRDHRKHMFRVSRNMENICFREPD